MFYVRSSIATQNVLVVAKYVYCLLSSSSMITVAWLGYDILILWGSDDALIMRWKVLLPSIWLLSIIVTLNKAMVTPLRKVTVYGPGS